jgi:hypothetical protein
MLATLARRRGRVTKLFPEKYEQAEARIEKSENLKRRKEVKM